MFKITVRIFILAVFFYNFSCQKFLVLRKFSLILTGFEIFCTNDQSLFCAKCAYSTFFPVKLNKKSYILHKNLYSNFRPFIL